MLEPLDPNPKSKIAKPKSLELDLELDLDVHARGQVEPHQRIHGLGRRLEHVDEALVRPHLKVLLRVLVDEWTTDDREALLLRGQRHRTRDVCPGALGRLDNLSR